MELPAWWPSVELLLGVWEATVLLRNVIPKDFSVNKIFRGVARLSIRDFFLLLLFWRCGPTRAVASSFMMFLDHTQRRTTIGRIPLDE